MLGSTLLRFLLPFTNMKTIGTCLLENIICILVEFRSTINLLVFVNHLYMYLLLLSDIVKFHNLYIYSMMGLLIYKYEPLWQEVSVKSLILTWSLRLVILGPTRPLMMSMNSSSCLSDTTRLLRKYHSRCLKVS